MFKQVNLGAQECEGRVHQSYSSLPYFLSCLLKASHVCCEKSDKVFKLFIAEQM